MKKVFFLAALAALSLQSQAQSGAKSKQKSYANKGKTIPMTRLTPAIKVAAAQPTFTEWHDLQVNTLNRLPMHTNFFP